MAELPSSQWPSYIYNYFIDIYKKKIEIDFLSSRPMCYKWGKYKN
jgi:hypothetical protein